ncbi:MAG: hypothetical protein LBJ32_01785 [Oscillospiraceae bacterium]|jgi:penicillin-binding protein 2|nr:hypothetical protein [Oscillospiraceae bacterium]
MNIDNKKRSLAVVIFVCTVFSVFIIRLVDWQIINSDYYNKRALSSNAYIIKSAAVRGEIFDSDGVGLVVNKIGYCVILDRLTAPRGKENKLIVEITKFIEKTNCVWNDTLPITISNGKFVFIDEKQSQIKDLKKFLKINSEASASDCIGILSKKFVCSSFNRDDRRRICSILYNSARNGELNTKAAPLIISENISQKLMLILSECLPNLPGIKINKTLVRNYCSGDLAPHIIGYISSMSSEEYEKNKGNYNIDEKIGKSGIEAAFEQKLRGYGGKKAIQLARNGDIIGTNDIVEPKYGNSIFLTISSKLQRCASESLVKNIKSAYEKGAHGCNSGAVVVLNVRDFSVLAAANYPTYNLLELDENRNYYSKLLQDSSLPLLNRAFSGTYLPGSVIKPITLCAALETGVLEPDEMINCNGAFNFYHGYTLRCMGKHGNINLIKAIAKSCNVFFAELGRRIGGSEFAKFAKKFGLGIKTGLEITESTGTLACPENSKTNNTPWYDSMASQAAIGQSDTSVTAIQLAAYAATIASGKRFKTHLVKKITNYSLTNTFSSNEIPELIESNIINEEKLNFVRSAMQEVAISGTASDFKNFPIKIAGKTGTAQNIGDDHTTFICYAPFENPEIAIAVILANGKYSINSKNVAKDILNCYFL